MGIIAGSLIHQEGELDLPDGSNLKNFFKLADGALGLEKTPYFKLSLKQEITPAILINGDPLYLPEALNHPLSEGDEISIILPMAGG